MQQTEPRETSFVCGLRQIFWSHLPCLRSECCCLLLCFSSPCLFTLPACESDCNDCNNPPKTSPPTLERPRQQILHYQDGHVNNALQREPTAAKRATCRPSHHIAHARACARAAGMFASPPCSPSIRIVWRFETVAASTATGSW